MMTKEQILKKHGIYPGFRSTYTYDGILSAMEEYAALIAAKPIVMCSAFTAEELDSLSRLKQLHRMLNDGTGLSSDEYDEYEGISSGLVDVLPIRG